MAGDAQPTTGWNSAVMGIREAGGTASLVIGAGFVGFGALCQRTAIPLEWALASSVLIWALPGQIVVVEMLASGAGLVALSLGVLLANIRLMPMVVTVLPVLRQPHTPRWQVLLAVHGIAATSWIMLARKAPDLPPDLRIPYLFGLTGLLAVVSTGCTFAGFLMGSLPDPLVLALIFTTPIYFILLTVDVANRPRLWSLGFGALLCPVFHQVSAQASLLLAGIVGGGLSFVISHRRRRHD